MAYFLIYNSDGDTYVREVAIEQTLREYANGEMSGDFAAMLPDTDTSCWGDNMVLIKGEIVTPKPVQVVTQYEVD